MAMKAKVLVVEDETILSDAYEAILESKGYKVKIAEDGDVGLEEVDKFKPDLILLDLRMPKVSGLEFLEEFYKDETKPKAKVIVFSNLDSQSEIDQAYQLGADRYMLKAWASPKELIQIVEDTLK